MVHTKPQSVKRSFNAAVELRAQPEAMKLLEALVVEPQPFAKLHRKGRPTRRLLNWSRNRYYLRCGPDGRYALSRRGAAVLFKAHEVVPIEVSMASVQRARRATARRRNT